MNVRPLSRSSLPVDAAELARYLIGKTIIRKIGRSKMSGRIVETEAYPPGDASGHAYRGQTARNRTLFLGPGFAYVYFIYGTSFMLNVSADEPGIGAGVLLRALEPIEGIERMRCNRNTEKLIDLARGPGRLAGALQIDKRYYWSVLQRDSAPCGRNIVRERSQRILHSDHVETFSLEQRNYLGPARSIRKGAVNKDNIFCSLRGVRLSERSDAKPHK